MYTYNKFTYLRYTYNKFTYLREDPAWPAVAHEPVAGRATGS
jgi:hypothetical protein